MKKKNYKTLAIIGLLLSIFVSGILGFIVSYIAAKNSKDKDFEAYTITGFGAGVAIIRLIFEVIIVIFFVVSYMDRDVYIQNPCQAAFNCICDGDTCNCNIIDEHGDILPYECPNYATSAD